MNKKGNTLIEIVVAFAIGAILISALAGVLSPVYSSYRRMLERSDAQAVAETVLDRIRTYTDTARSVTPSNDGSAMAIGEHVLSTNTDGYLTIDDVVAYDGKYYNGKTVSVVFSPVDGLTYSASVSVTVYNSENTELCSVSGVVSSVRKLLG